MAAEVDTVKTTFNRKDRRLNSSLLCRVCEANVYGSYCSTYYSLLTIKAREQNIFERIKGLFGVEEDDVSVGPKIVCKKCFRKIKRYEATFEELTSIREVYQTNLARWKNEARSSSSGLPVFIEQRYSPLSCARHSDGGPSSLETLSSANVKTSLNEKTTERPADILHASVKTFPGFLMAGVKTTSEKRKKGRPYLNLPLLCRVCEENVVVGEGYCSGYYSLFSMKTMGKKIFARIKGLFGVEDDNVSFGPHIVCKKCFKKVERYEATFKELSSFREFYQTNFARWAKEAQSQSSSSPVFEAERSPLSSCGARDSGMSFTETITSPNVKTSLNEKTIAVGTEQLSIEHAKENMKLSINPGKAQKRRLDMASAFPSTDQTQKETSTACLRSTEAIRVSSPLSGSQDAPSVYPINVPSSLMDPSLQPTALVFPSGIAFDYENFPKLVSISWPVITDLSGNTVMARDGPTRGTSLVSASSNDIPTTCTNNGAGASVFRWDRPQDEAENPVISTPVIKVPICALHNNCEAQSETITSNSNAGCLTNASMRQQMPTIVQPGESPPIHPQRMFKRPKLQHVEISAQILLNGNFADCNSNDDATVPRMPDHNQLSVTNPDHVSVCLSNVISGSLSQEKEKGPVFGQVLVSPDNKHSDSTQAIIRKILPGKTTARTRPLRVSFCLTDDLKQSTGSKSTAVDQEKNELVPCSSNSSDEQLSKLRLEGENNHFIPDKSIAETPRNSLVQQNTEESTLTTEGSPQAFASKRATVKVTSESDDDSSGKTINKNIVELSEQSYVFIHTPSKASQTNSHPSTVSANQSIGSAHQSAISLLQSSGSVHQTWETGNKQGNVRDLIARIRYIKSKLHRAECEQRKKQMLKTILGLQKRVKALAKGMRKEKVDSAKEQRETSDTSNRGETMSCQSLPGVGHPVKSVSQVKDMALHVDHLGKDKGDTLLLPDTHQLSPALCNSNDVENDKTNNSNRQRDRGSLSLLGSNGKLNDFIVTLPAGFGLDSPLGNSGKRSLPSSSVGENTFPRNEDIASKKMKRLSLSDNDVLNMVGNESCRIQDIQHEAQCATQDGKSKNVTPTEKNNILDGVNHAETNAIESEICVTNKEGTHSCRFQDVTHDAQGITQNDASERLVLNENNAEKNRIKYAETNLPEKQIFDSVVKNEKERGGTVHCNLKDVTSVAQNGILLPLPPIANKGGEEKSTKDSDNTDLAQNGISESLITDEVGKTVSLAFEDITHDAQSVTQSGISETLLQVEEERNVKPDETNVAQNEIPKTADNTASIFRTREVTQYNSTVSYRGISLAPDGGNKDMNSVTHDETNLQRDNSAILTGDPNLANVKEEKIVDRMLYEGGEGKHSATCQDIDRDCSATADGITVRGSSCSKANGTEDGKMEEEQPGLADHDPYTQEMKAEIELITDSAVPLKDAMNEHDRELLIKNNGAEDVKMKEKLPFFTDHDPGTQVMQGIEQITDSAVPLEDNENNRELLTKNNGTEDVKMKEGQPDCTGRDPCTQGMQDIEVITDSAVPMEDNEHEQELLTQNNGTEDVKIKEEQLGSTARDPCTQEMQDIELITDSAVPLEDNDNDQELFRFSLATVLKEEGTQRFTSPTLHNPSGSQEDRDLMQSLQIRQARILNLTQKRDRLFNLVGLKMNRL